MFGKRGTDYVMQMDVEVNYDSVDAFAREENIDPAVVRSAGLDSLIRHVSNAAKAAVKEHGQKWRGEEVDREGEWPRFSVRLQGDQQEAAAAYEGWANKVQALGGTRRILRASLRGADGTNVQYMDEEYERELDAMFDELPPESQNMIHRMMDPDA